MHLAYASATWNAQHVSTLMQIVRAKRAKRLENVRPDDACSVRYMMGRSGLYRL